LFCWVELHRHIYKGSYNVSNISYLNSPPTTGLFHHPSPNSWNSFSSYPFCIYICVYIICTVFILLLLSRPPLPSHWCQPLPPPSRTCSATCSPIL
jgi:hypothetical protein